MAEADELVRRVQELRNHVEARTVERVRLQGQRESFATDLQAYKDRLRDAGIEPSKLDELVDAAKQDLETRLADLETLIHA
jgi:predicted nuclease with TOPRIM domain